MMLLKSLTLSELHVRRATIPDIPAIVELVNLAYRGGDCANAGWTTEAHLLGGQRTDGDELALLIESQESMVLLGELDKEIVGSVHLEKYQEGAYLGMLAVTPGLQGRGIGKRLKSEAEQIAKREWKAGKMLMTVISLRHDVIAYYQRCGYSRIGRMIPFPASEKCGIQKVKGLQLEFLQKVLC